jgi:uncharacterized membrane protein
MPAGRPVGRRTNGTAYHVVMARLSDRRVATIFALVLASGFCVALLAAREWHTGSNGYRFLVWNLILAWIPFLLALVFYDGCQRGRSKVGLAVIGALWLLFLPNAPYMVTDLVHLGSIPGAPLWFDGAMIAAFAGTGLLLGLVSVSLVHAVALRVLGRLLGWAALLPVLGLCSLGVVLGRFGRLNSWDVVVRPMRLGDLLAERLADPVGDGRAAVATLGYTAFLALAYVVLYSLSSLHLEFERNRPKR